MEKQEKSPKQLRKRKFLMVMPLLALPFLTFAFWALGGGQVRKAEASTVKQAGLNSILPSSGLSEKEPMNKMQYYNQAKEDSLHYKELISNDPNYTKLAYEPLQDSVNKGEAAHPVHTAGINTSLNGNSRYNDPNEEKIYKKLAQLNSQLAAPVAPLAENSPAVQEKPKTAAVAGSDIDRLEEMMQMMTAPQGPDTELQQLDGMLTKILDIKYPGRVQERLKERSRQEKGQVFPVSTITHEKMLTSLDNKATPLPVTASEPKNGFYSLEDPMAVVPAQNAIRAVVHGRQTLVSGERIKLRLTDDVFINGVRIAKGSFIFGSATLNDDRLMVQIDLIRYGASLFPVSLAVHDIDGMPGINISKAITRDVVKQSGGQSLQGLGMGALDPTLGEQAASAGIQFGQNLLKKRIKLVKVTLPAEYNVLLLDENQKQ